MNITPATAGLFTSSLIDALIPVEQHIVNSTTTPVSMQQRVKQLMDGITKGHGTIDAGDTIESVLPVLQRIGSGAAQVLAIAQTLPLPPQAALAVSIASALLPALGGINAAILAHVAVHGPGNI